MFARQTRVVVLLVLLWAGLAQAADSRRQDPGKDIIYDRVKGNCLACHGFPTLADAEQTGNSGPPLIAMRARFPNKAVLRALIWDATAANPDSIMPPFGRHLILSEEEIDKVVDFLYGL